jgi:transposase
MLYDLRDHQWEIIKDILPEKKRSRGRTGDDNRGFIRAVM